MSKLTIKAPKLTDYQKAFLYPESKARFRIVLASTKCGKTFSCIWYLFEQAHKSDVKEGDNFWWVSPTYSQSKIAFKRMKRKVIKSKVYSINESNLTITCPNGAVISFKSADNEDNLYGDDVKTAIFDEASRAKEEAWFALRSTLTATKGDCILIANYKGQGNWLTLLAEKAETDSTYEKFVINAYDAVEAGILSLEEVEQAKKDLPEKIFKELYLAEGGGEAGQLIDEESISKLFTNQIGGGIKYITIDVARLGKDKSVIYVWDGLKVIEIKELAKNTLIELSKEIRELQAKYNVNLSNIIADENGVGGFLCDHIGCKGFVNNASPLKVKGEKQNFASLKDQCYYKLAEIINSNLISITSINYKTKELLIQELQQIKLPAEVDTNRIKLLNKDAIKKIIGRSPDYSDAMMMRMYFELRPNYGVYHIG
ncbi:terminase large subunit domain-containing protein [Galbibacter pacificus]|uniref:Terminase family protein n=1 Tax=Galbibacter pacificus TaxID=2996052 RepID=A0ABT6FQD8_9FLAO|nr:terminase family protein [Galbibacter pacificus]MDG3582041.1 terminase family protein [Galbibacter pacificus]MDG3585485.1 terminase family protein [Galbibacter pacificus]